MCARVCVGHKCALSIHTELYDLQAYSYSLYSLHHTPAPAAIAAKPLRANCGSRKEQTAKMQTAERWAMIKMQLNAKHVFIPFASHSRGARAANLQCDTHDLNV